MTVQEYWALRLRGFKADRCSDWPVARQMYEVEVLLAEREKAREDEPHIYREFGRFPRRKS